MNEFRLPELHSWTEEYKYLGLFYCSGVVATGRGKEPHEIFMTIDSFFRRAFGKDPHTDYDFPFRAAEFVGDLQLLTPQEKIGALAFINLLCISEDRNAANQGKIIRDMLLFYCLSGEAPPTAEQFYSPSR